MTIPATLTDAVIASALGLLFGATELLRRYADPPWVPFRTYAGWTYLLINAVASGSALALTRLLGWSPTPPGDFPSRLLQILAAGLGAMSVLRSTFYSVKVGGSQESASPATLLAGLIETADRQVEQRYRAFFGREAKALVAAGIDYDYLSTALPTTVLSLGQTLSVRAEEEFGGPRGGRIE